MISDMKLRQLVLGDERWTFQNKLMGLRGVCSFWERDLAILKEDDQVKKEKTFRNIKRLSNEVLEQQYELVSTLRGGYQRIRNILASDIRSQLAFQELPPEKILENLDHQTFILKKRMDLLKNKKRLKLKELKDIMIEISRIEERTKLNFKSEQQQFEQQRIMNLIDKETLKYNSAKTTESTLKRIIHQLERDMDYFDTVMKLLKSDAEEQSKCVALTIQLGQKVAEDMGANKVETQQIENAIRGAMHEREDAVKFVRQLYRDIAVRTGMILRTDSGTSINLESEELESQKNALIKELNYYEEQLKNIKRATMVNTFEEIMPSFENQQITKEKLFSAFEKHLKTRDDFAKKKMESSILLEQNEHNFGSTAYNIKESKGKYMQLLLETSENRKENERLLDKDGQLQMKIIRGTLSLLELLIFVDHSFQEPVQVETFPTINKEGKTEKLPYLADAISHLKLLLRKVDHLMKYITEIISPEDIEWAKQKFMERIIDNAARHLMIEDYPEPPNVETEEMDDQVPTRQDIKTKAFKLVEFMEKNASIF